jgi:hypothetical protein
LRSRRQAPPTFLPHASTLDNFLQLFLNLPFVIWILKPFFDSLPREIEEAAQLDGVGFAAMADNPRLISAAACFLA